MLKRCWGTVVELIGTFVSFVIVNSFLHSCFARLLGISHPASYIITFNHTKRNIHLFLTAGGVSYIVGATARVALFACGRPACLRSPCHLSPCKLLPPLPGGLTFVTFTTGTQFFIGIDAGSMPIFPDRCQPVATHGFYIHQRRLLSA